MVCIAKQCLIEIGQRFEDFAKCVDELGKEIEEDGERLFNGLFGLNNETFDEVEKNKKLKRFEALYNHFFHAAATRGGANGGVVRMAAGRSDSNVVWEREVEMRLRMIWN